MKKLFSLAASLVFVLCCAATASAWDNCTAIDANASVNDPQFCLEEFGTNSCYILDIRSPAEYKWTGHPDLSEDKLINIPWKLWESDRNADDGYSMPLNKFFDAAVYRQFEVEDEYVNPTDITLIVMCRSGGRARDASDELDDLSQPACQRLEELGSFNVLRMLGGFSKSGGGENGWVLSGLPVDDHYPGIWKPSDHKGRSLK